MVRAVATDSEWAAHTDTSSSVQYLSLYPIFSGRYLRNSKVFFSFQKYSQEI